MSCSPTAIVCGTGGWSGPKPGDPDNNSILSARGVYGGIEVSWTYPTLNSHAVIHTLLYRGISDVFAAATQIAVVAGNRYLDRFTESEKRTYYYWIQIVSVNGTVADPIGPASAIPMSTIDEVITDLTNRIDEGLLATTLRERIARLDVLSRDLSQEILDRVTENENFAALLAAVQSETGEATTLLLEEVNQRKTADTALITSIDALAVDILNNTAAILEEQTVRVTQTEALASDVGSLYARSSANEAAILTEATTRATETAALTTDLSALTASVAANSASIQSEAQTRADQDSALSSRIDSVVAVADAAAAAVQTEAATRATAVGALAEQITTTQTTLNGDMASIQTAMQTNIDAVKGTVEGLYTARVDVNGLVGGFGIYNNSQMVEAGFNVDTFWVGRTTDRKKPFIVYNDQVYIDSALIRQLSASQIDTRGLTIKDAAGNIILGSGTNLDWTKVGNKPYFGTLSGMNDLDATYIKNLVVDTIHIKNNATAQVKSFAFGSQSYGTSGFSTSQSWTIPGDVPAGSQALITFSANIENSRVEALRGSLTYSAGGYSNTGRMFFQPATAAGNVDNFISDAFVVSLSGGSTLTLSITGSSVVATGLNLVRAMFTVTILKKTTAS